MKFEDLASAVFASQNESKGNTLANLFTTNVDSAHDIITICCANPRSSIKPHHVVKMLAQSYGLFPEEYESLMDEHEMPMLLASESPQDIESSLTLREGIEEMLHRAEAEMNMHQLAINNKKTTMKQKAQHMRDYKGLQGVCYSLRWVLGDRTMTRAIVLGRDNE